MAFYQLKGTDRVFFVEDDSAQAAKLSKRKDMKKVDKPTEAVE